MFKLNLYFSIIGVTMDLSFFSLYQKEAKTFPFNRYSLDCELGNLRLYLLLEATRIKIFVTMNRLLI